MTKSWFITDSKEESEIREMIETRIKAAQKYNVGLTWNIVKKGEVLTLKVHNGNI